ncbi:preprotein translocase subunit SecA [Myxococcota bacterium]|nr:preprotein translocase subunit SecA [Myxococcota bacterium]
MLAISSVARMLFGTKHDREMKRIRPQVDQINGLEDRLSALSLEELRGRTAEFRQRIENGSTLDDLLPEAFATVREASKRILGMRHYDVQLIGGVVLHEGKIAEMKTGEGKTLVATLAVYLNALGGKGVHVVTVNEYLARRDAEWMGRIYRALGLDVGVVVHGVPQGERRRAYAADITYGTNNEYGFDYLRDNMKLDLAHMVQRGHNYAIVDEVDSILIDEARTPLIISGPTEDSVEKYYEIDKVIPGLQTDIDYTIDEKARSAALTDEGITKVEKRLGIRNLYEPENIELLHHVNQALRAHTLFRRDRDYVVKEGQVIIVDEFTGRLLPGRRWSDGLHQAIEAKERVEIEAENQTLATITFQKYFQKYKKLAGMTGTADTEAVEFHKTYKLDVVAIPTNRRCVRTDLDDVVFKSEDSKFRAAAEEIEEMHKAGRPVLVGTVSVEKSERLSNLLKKKGLPHHVLNAKNHAREAEIVAQAGRKGGITLSTNMAGRGTDILLGGNPEFMARDAVGPHDPAVEPEEEWRRRYDEALERCRAECEAEKAEVVARGGLHIVGTERHESRRIDNQLRGRAGRQGDPGSSRFYLSLQDDLMRIFGSDRLTGMMERLGMEDDVPLEHRWLNRAIENAQGKVEGHHFNSRKNLLEYDDVLSQQRDAVYGIRNRILGGADTQAMVLDMIDELIDDVFDRLIPPRTSPEEMDVDSLNQALKDQFFIEMEVTRDELAASENATVDRVKRRAREEYERREGDIVENHVRVHEGEGAGAEELERQGHQILRNFEREILLRVIDHLWKDHLLAMDHLRGGIGLRGYGQRNPLLEYKKEGFEMFNQMLAMRDEAVIRRIFEQLAHSKLTREEVETLVQARKRAAAEAARRQAQAAAQATQGNGAGRAGMAVSAAAGTVPKAAPTPRKVGRNDPCWCGSGKKFKKCHGGEAEAQDQAVG